MGYDPIEVNQAASKAARAIRKSGGSGYVEKKSLTYNGNSEGKETFKFNSLDFARIGDCIDPTAISKIDMLFNGSPLAISKDEIVVTNHTEHDTALSFNGAVGVWILGDENEMGVSAGTYVLSVKTYGSYVTRITTATIHPIDPKYLPGVCLPVVELEDYPDPSEGAKTLSDKEAEQVKKALATSGYCLVFMLNTYETFIAKRHDEALGFIGFPLMSNASGGIGKLMLIGTEDGTTYISSWIDN